MKALTTLLTASAVGLALIGCANQPHHVAMAHPAIDVDTGGNIMVGESTHVIAHTTDLAGSSAVTWKVSPDVAKIRTDTKDGQTAVFTADQPGTYIINAMVQRPDGSMVTSPDTTIRVNGRMASEK